MSSIPAIVRSLEDLYQLLRNFGYIAPHSIVPGPHNDLNWNVCQELGMSQVAIKVLHAIPWVVQERGELIPNSFFVDNTENDDLGGSRAFYPTGGLDHPFAVHPNGNMFSLTKPAGYLRRITGQFMVLDASRGQRIFLLGSCVGSTHQKAGTIRMFDGSCDISEVEEQDAETAIRAIYDSYRRLEDIPWGRIIIPASRPRVNGVNMFLDSKHQATCHLIRTAAYLHNWHTLVRTDEFPTQQFLMTAEAFLRPLENRNREVGDDGEILWDGVSMDSSNDESNGDGEGDARDDAEED